MYGFFSWNIYFNFPAMGKSSEHTLILKNLYLNTQLLLSKMAFLSFSPALRKLSYYFSKPNPNIISPQTLSLTPHGRSKVLCVFKTVAIITYVQVLTSLTQGRAQSHLPISLELGTAPGVH